MGDYGVNQQRFEDTKAALIPFLCERTGFSVQAVEAFLEAQDEFWVRHFEVCQWLLEPHEEDDA